MTKHEALKLMRMLFAMESWVMAQGKVVPDYLLKTPRARSSCWSVRFLGLIRGLK